MVRYILCEQPLASVPYYVENIQLNIYSVQELCFLIGTEPELADETLLNRQLAGWLETECGFSKQEKDMAELLFTEEKGKETAVFLLENGGYYYGADLKKAIENVERSFRMSEHDRIKKKGDALMRHKKYEKARAVYSQALEFTAGNPYMNEFRSDVLYNCGCADAALFRTGKASDEFRKAYQLDQKHEKLIGYLSAVYLDKGKDRFIEEAKEYALPESETEELLKDYGSIELPGLPEDMDGQIAEWIKEYHEFS